MTLKERIAEKVKTYGVYFAWHDGEGKHLAVIDDTMINDLTDFITTILAEQKERIVENAMTENRADDFCLKQCGESQKFMSNVCPHLLALQTRDRIITLIKETE